MLRCKRDVVLTRGFCSRAHMLRCCQPACCRADVWTCYITCCHAKQIAWCRADMLLLSGCDPVGSCCRAHMLVGSRASSAPEEVFWFLFIAACAMPTYVLRGTLKRFT